MRYRARVQYDGTDFAGFQRQRTGVRTVQGEIERALEHITHRPVSITGSGRTDSGVHALGQVVAFDLEWPHGSAALLRALNAALADDVAIDRVGEAEATFHPRYDAKRRTYRYVIDNVAFQSPLRRRYAWHVRSTLDVKLLNEASAVLQGTHDFGTFGQPPAGHNRVRTVEAACWQQNSTEFIFTVTANAFLYRMVRSLVGSLVAVGTGRWTVVEFEDAFRAMRRERAAATAPPHGLVLLRVSYEDRPVS